MKPAVCVIIISKDRKILLTKRQYNMSFSNAWVFPGGHLEPYETMEQGAAREVYEETGIFI